MKQSEFFFKSQKESPKDETAENARLLIRANFVEKLMAGVYSMLPLGLRVRKNIIKIIREEMDALGANELLMPALHPRSVWDITGRWEGMKQVMYQFKDNSGREVGLGATHEEVITHIVKKNVESYADLPLFLYQIQGKFRDEERPKSGLLRGREFTMKDLYSFHVDENSLDKFYKETKKAYTKIFERCGLKSIITEASGGDFSKEYSHEFMVEAEVGEDDVFVCRLCGFSRNKEIADFKNKDQCINCNDGVLEKIKSIEVGNIFKLGTRFSEPVGLNYKTKEGNLKPVVMGSYGIGVERLMGTVVEVHHDKNGIIWPSSIAPFHAHLLLIGEETSDLKKSAESVYNKLTKAGIEILYDNRNHVSAGEKFFDADLIGIPWRLVVSDKTLIQEKVEVKRRGEEEVRLVKMDDLVKMLGDK